MARLQAVSGFSIFVVLGCLLLSSCASPAIKTYPGPELSDGQVGTLFVPRIFNRVAVDGIDVPLPRPEIGLTDQAKAQTFDKITMLPGSHEITWSGTLQDANRTYRGSGILRALAGKQYLIRCDFQVPVSQATSQRLAVTDFTTWIEDGKTGLILVCDRPTWLPPAHQLANSSPVEAKPAMDDAFPYGGLPYPVSTDLDGTAGVVLRFAPKENQRLGYKIWQVTHALQYAAEWEEGVRVEENTFTYSANSAGAPYTVAWTGTTLRGGWQESQSAVDRRNRAMEVAGGQWVPKSNRGGWDFAYPEEPMRPGFAWEGTWALPSDDKNPLVTRIAHWHCMGYATIDNHHCVVIEGVASWPKEVVVGTNTMHTTVGARTLLYIDRDSGLRICAVQEDTVTVTANHDPKVRVKWTRQTFQRLVSE